MARQTAMVRPPPALVAARERWLRSSMAPASPQWPSPHAPLARLGRSTGEPSDDAHAAAASAWWCGVDGVTPAAALDVPSGAPVDGEGRARTADGGRGRHVTCGLWLARRRLVAALVGPGGEARRVLRSALTDEARFGLVEYLAAVGAEVVAAEALARIELMPMQAARRGLAVWTVGDALLAALLQAAAIRDPARAAALLARLPAIPLLRGVVRRLVLPDSRQLPLL